MPRNKITTPNTIVIDQKFITEELGTAVGSADFEKKLNEYCRGMLNKSKNYIFKDVNNISAIFEVNVNPSDMPLVNCVVDYAIAEYCMKNISYSASATYYKKSIGHNVTDAKTYIRSCVNLGKLYFEGRMGIIRRYEQAKRWFDKAEKLNNIEAMYYLGRMYFEGSIKEEGVKGENKYFNKIFKAGDTCYIREVGLCMKRKFDNSGGRVSDITRISKYLEEASRLNDAEAVRQCALMSDDSRYIKNPSPKEKRAGLKRAANLGSIEALNDLFIDCLDGKALEKDVKTQLSVVQEVFKGFIDKNKGNQDKVNQLAKKLLYLALIEFSNNPYSLDKRKHFEGGALKEQRKLFAEVFVGLLLDCNGVFKGGRQSLDESDTKEFNSRFINLSKVREFILSGIEGYLFNNDRPVPRKLDNLPSLSLNCPTRGMRKGKEKTSVQFLSDLVNEISGIVEPPEKKGGRKHKGYDLFDNVGRPSLVASRTASGEVVLGIGVGGVEGTFA